MSSKRIHVYEEITLPENIEVTIDGLKITIRGPRGVLTRDFSHVSGVFIRREDNKLIVESYFTNRRRKALVGTIISHIRNMVIGVTRGYRYRLKIIYSHFPISIVVDNENRVVRIKNFVGEKSDRFAKIIGDDVRVRVEGDEVVVEGIDIENVAQTAANIELATKISDKDKRIFVDGIYLHERGVAE